jgi:hypothetical protein
MTEYKQGGDMKRQGKRLLAGMLAAAAVLWFCPAEMLADSGMGEGVRKAATASGLYRAVQDPSCRRIVLGGNITLKSSLSVSKNLTICAFSRREIVAQRAVAEVVKNGKLVLDGSITVRSASPKARVLSAAGRNAAVAVKGNAVIRGGAVGIYSRGNEITVSSGKITGAAEHGIEMNRGILKISGGAIYANGTLGSSRNRGSYGGGIFLYDGAVLRMDGGILAGNRGCSGAALYIDDNCSAKITAGRIGGIRGYYGAPSLDHFSVPAEWKGNYARESAPGAAGRKYTGGEGGAVYNRGLLEIAGSRQHPVSMNYNVAKGQSGGGAIGAAGGSVCVTGYVQMSYNRTWSSDAKNASQLVDSSDRNGEGGAIRIGWVDSVECTQLFLGCSRRGQPVESRIAICGNRASGDGGAIMLSNHMFELCRAIGNRTADGSIRQSEILIADNYSAEDGGGAVKATGGNLYLSGCTFQNNTSRTTGGAVASASGHTEIHYNYFLQNRSKGTGSGIQLYHSSGGSTAAGSIRGNLFRDNRSGSGGVLSISRLRKKRVTVADNRLLRSRPAACLYRGSRVTAGGNQIMQTAGDGVKISGGVVHMSGEDIAGNNGHGISNSGILYLRDSRIRENQSEHGNGILLSGDGKLFLQGNLQMRETDEIYLKGQTEICLSGAVRIPDAGQLSIGLPGEQRRPGRVMVRNRSGKSDEDLFYPSGGRGLFRISFARTVNREQAVLRKSGLKQQKTDTGSRPGTGTLYLSEAYRIRYHGNLKKSFGRLSSDEIQVPKTQIKYWKEDMRLSLQEPELSENARRYNYFSGWIRKTDGKKQTGNSFTENHSETLYADWKENTPPEAELPERYFSLTAVRGGLVTAEVLKEGLDFSKIRDKESGVVVRFPAWNDQDAAKNLRTGSHKIQVRVTDERDRSTSAWMILHIVDPYLTRGTEPHLRFVSPDYSRTGREAGGFSEKSIWRTKEGQQRLEQLWKRRNSGKEYGARRFSWEDILRFRKK